MLWLSVCVHYFCILYFLALPVIHSAFHLQVSAECWQDAHPAITLSKDIFLFILLRSICSPDLLCVKGRIALISRIAVFFKHPIPASI